MKSIRRTAAIFLTLAILLASAVMAGAEFNKNTAAGGIFQLNVVHSVEIPALEEDSYTIWTSAVCFTAGRDAAGQLYLITDADLAKGDRMLSTLSQSLVDLLLAGGVNTTADDLANQIKIVDTAYYLVYEGGLIELSIISQTVSNNVLLLKPQADVEASVFPYAYADSYEKEDTIHTFALSGAETDGFVPATEDAYITNWSFTTTQGEILVPATIDDGYVSCTMADIPMSRSSQGAPLFDENGNVIGINLWIDNCENTMSLTSSTIMAILDQAGIQYTVNEHETAGFSITEAFLYLGIAVVLIIILIILLIVLHSRRKKLEEEDLSQLELEASRARAEYARQQNTAQTQVHPVRPAASARPVAPQNAAVSHTPATTGLPPVRPANATAQYTTVMLTVLDGPMKGYSANITDKITLGRDPEACGVVFPANAAPVSRRHCTISFNKNTGRVLLEDLNSSNGTYFPSGTRIIPGRLYALRPGDRFYLGLPENLVEVRMQ